MRSRAWQKRIWAVPALCAAMVTASPAQGFTTLVTFNGSNGTNPTQLLQGLDGSMYGTTVVGGANNAGTVFKIAPGGALTTLHSFCALTACSDGGQPFAGLAQSVNGMLYGTTYGGLGIGVNYGLGTVFQITPAGTLTTLHTFSGNDGANPYDRLAQGTDGSFYGTTQSGGSGAYGYGTVFKITPGGNLTSLHSFAGTDGDMPFAGLTEGTDGSFYGTTAYGGASGYGSIFRITPAGALTPLHTFAASDGDHAFGGLIQATDGNFYGTTESGGSNLKGTIYKITPAGALTTLYSFCSQTNCSDGANPYAGFVQGTDGKLYGTTELGGTINSNCPQGCGTVFSITRSGTLTTLHRFSWSDGAGPVDDLLQDTDGRFYGTTFYGLNAGTVYRLSLGLGPFVKTLPLSGKVGSVVRILGTSLASATAVSFQGVAAPFAVVSATEISTMVPVGASTGIVQVTTPSSTLASNLPFRVRP